MADKRIVVIQSGWVVMGDYVPANGAVPAHVNNAVQLARWGTTQGLGEIALNGPTKETVMYDLGTVILDNPAAVLYTIPCRTLS